MTGTVIQSEATVRFKNPPIIEAVIAINISALPEAAVQDFKAQSEKLAVIGYTLAAPVSSHEFLVQIEAGASAVHGRDAIIGYRFNSDDGLHSVQFNRTGFVFSRLGNYDSWEVFTAEAKRLWAYYIESAGAAVLSAYQVRYVNKLFVPDGREPCEFLNAFVQFPDQEDGKHPSFQEYLLRVALPVDEPAGRLIHQQVLLPPERSGYSTLILDNDFHFPALNLTLTSLWEAIDSVRKTKDRYFLTLLTEEMKRSFDA